MNDALRRAMEMGEIRAAEEDPSYSNPYLPGTKKYKGVMMTPGTKGFTLYPKDDPAQNTLFQGRHLSQRKDPNEAISNDFHELEHLLAGRNTGAGHHPLGQGGLSTGISAEEYYGFQKKLREVLDKNKESLKATYMVTRDSAYMDNPKGTEFTELMALMNQIEDTYKVDLTKDRRFEELFADPVYKEMYNSSRGYRRTRMDARDPKPYTPMLKEGDKRSFLDRMWLPRKSGY